MLLVRMRQDIATLQRLREEPEDIVTNQQSALRAARTRGVRLHAIDGRPLALLLVAIADDRRDGAAGLALGRSHFRVGPLLRCERGADNRGSESGSEGWKRSDEVRSRDGKTVQHH